MKKIFLILVVLLSFSLFDAVTAQPPPPPPPGIGGMTGGKGLAGNDGPGAPVGSGTFILIGLALAYGSKRVYDAQLVLPEE